MSGRDIRSHPCDAVPELVLIASTRIRAPLPRLEIPWDPDCGNLYVSTKGSKQMQCQGRTYTLRGGECFWTPPGVDHATGPMPVSKCSHYWLRLDLAGSGVFLGDAASAPLRDALAALGVVHARIDEEAIAHAARCYELARRAAGFARDQELRHRLGLLLLGLIDLAERSEEPAGHPAIGAITVFVDRNLGQPIGVEDLTRVAGVGHSTLSELCQRELGMPPAEFVTRRKLDEAKRLLLETELPVREVSQRLGFSSERYFSSVFRRYHPEPPGRFRKQFQASAGWIPPAGVDPLIAGVWR